MVPPFCLFGLSLVGLHGLPGHQAVRTLPPGLGPGVGPGNPLLGGVHNLLSLSHGGFVKVYQVQPTGTSPKVLLEGLYLQVGLGVAWGPPE